MKQIRIGIFFGFLVAQTIFTLSGIKAYDPNCIVDPQTETIVEQFIGYNNKEMFLQYLK